MNKKLDDYKKYLVENEKCNLTIQKYCRDVTKFYTFIEERNKELSKESVIEFKRSLLDKYKSSSANSIIVALNGYLRFIGFSNYCIKTYKIQKHLFVNEDKSLDNKDYQKLVNKNNSYKTTELLHTFAVTGIRVSELKFITVESLNKGQVQIYNKGKVRVILLIDSLVKRLMKYCKKTEIKSGSIFITKNGNPLDRSNIWRMMKKCAKRAGVLPSKVFPHNFRHLFAKMYYDKQKDLVRLADFLGHSSLETTRLYTSTSNIGECRAILESIFLQTKYKTT